MYNSVVAASLAEAGLRRSCGGPSRSCSYDARTTRTNGEISLRHVSDSSARQQYCSYSRLGMKPSNEDNDGYEMLADMSIIQPYISIQAGISIPVPAV